MAENFVHLHNHTEYSMLDGAAKIDELFAETKRLGMDSIAMTDHGFLFGAYEFWKKAQDYDIRPIIGLEAYLTPGTHRTDKTRVRFGDGIDDVSGTGAYTHMTMWASTTEGMHNLFRLGSRASMEGHFYKPRADRELLSQYGKGLIATTGCPSGEVQTRLRQGQYQEAKQAVSDFRDIFGAENFFCEIMDHGNEIERRTKADLLRLAKEMNLPLVATNDLHYTHEHDAHTHSALLCLQTAATLDDPKRFKFEGEGYYLKSPAAMRELFREFPEACDNTLAIAERCEVEFNLDASYMPRFPVPEGETEESWFIKEVQKGLHYRYPDGIPDEVQEQAQYEIGVITQMGFPGYFLVVADFINWAKENGIRVGPGRGSGAGSMVAYAMRITDLDPLQHGLIFERFLNPDRVSMPDFDVDFDDRRRSEVIDYVVKKYGDERVAMIATYGTIKSKQALKDSARVMGEPFQTGETLTKAMPPDQQGKPMPLSDIYDKNSKRYAEAGEFRETVDADPRLKEIFGLAEGLEGLKRQWGVHAAGVIMSSDPLIDVIPLMRREQDGAIITQFDYPTCETLGLIKMDFLGLRNLTIISDALENVQQNKGVQIDLETLDLDDRPSYELLASGKTLGVFQLDGSGLQSLLKAMKPDNFEDISATIALYRPGPMGADSHTNYAKRKNGLQPVTPIHPELEEPLADILDTTYGLIIYQEQVMAIAQKVAGYSLGQADILRRAMGKKKKSELDKQQVGFFEGMAANGFSREAAQKLWDILLPFSDYAFNKAHSAAYGLIAYWTAYLKANYPAEYMAALLTSVGENRDKLAMYLSECRRMGITVTAPSINDSALTFTPVGDDTIRFGMGAVRNVGANVVAGIVNARQEKGRYVSFVDFFQKVPAQVCNKRTIDSLIKAGGFDELGHTRRALVTIHELAVDQAVKQKKDSEQYETDIFGAFADGDGEDAGFEAIKVPELPEYQKKDKLNFERDMLGLYVSDHPLSGMERTLAAHAERSVPSILSEDGPADGATVTVCGMITSLQRKVAKSGNPYARAEIEDLAGSIEVMFFGKTYQAVSMVLAEDLIIAVKGQVDRREDGAVVLKAMDVTVPEITEDGVSGPVVLSMPVQKATEKTITELGATLQGHRGKSEVHIRLLTGEKVELMRLGSQYQVTPSPALYGDLKVLLGPACLES
ncbi:DNA polymerase III subunit alpha [Nesterenkonia alkaliphila]|uniref:DNA polymerase III subunit alpha n=1 Tax=Nesterenkonia alkaliphila TaxID=1463631 RepID=A0A7K1UG65_9MICC|nr:DNA polymerase III subunit alpha [Nesterenkonia alkaliphila]MVT25460.1 DNA polymerase III subunit alpha [Nesterenkonia alkaliphila]GFZ83795.1 DNA-directed DNA polymerase [Nesterenkonia alkaliphila]